MSRNIDWKNLGFAYMQTESFVKCEYRDGKWGKVETVTDPMISIHVAATSLHYGQACFEGLKAFRRKDGTMALFRPQANAQRMISTADRTMMVAPSEELFVEMCRKAVYDNRDWMPPYGTGASMYVRPVLIGTTPRIGLNAATEYLFAVLAMPVGPYYKDGFFPVKAMIQEAYDRAAPKGVGNVKVAGNYAAGLKGDFDGKHKGYSICVYLDSAEHKYIDEFGTSNFFAISKDNAYVTPASTSILPSITNASLQQIAKDMGMRVEKRPIPVTELPQFAEIGACGTAAVITPVCSITHGDKTYTYGSEKQSGATLTKLFEQLQGIQYGDLPDRHGWMVPVE